MTLTITAESVEDLARELCDTYYLTVDPKRPMLNAYDKITERTRVHWLEQATLMLARQASRMQAV